MTTYNTDLMLQVRNQITAEPDSHDQEYYENHAPECGTTRCIAGWAIYFATGGLNVFRMDETPRPNESVFEQAQVALGLSTLEANSLFFKFDEFQALKALDQLIEKGKNQ